VIAAPGQACEKSAGGLNSILRIAREPNYGVIDVFRPQIGPGRRAGWSAVCRIGFWQNWS